MYLKNSDGSFTVRVGTFIIKDGKLLVAKCKNYPCYYTVGGAVEINETSEEAAIREVFEETGFKLEVDRLFCVQERFFTVGEQRCHEINLFYLMKINEDFNVVSNSYTEQSTNETLQWIPLKDMNVNIVPESLKYLIMKLIWNYHIISKRIARNTQSLERDFNHIIL